MDNITIAFVKKYVEKALGESSGSGSTADYAALTNKPKINGVELAGDKSLNDLGAEPAGTAASKVSSHNVDTAAHSDLRAELKALADRINAALDSDDATLDELSEIVAYIKSNKTLIESVTTSKVNVADIVNDLVTNVANKPLSAAQGVALKALIDAITVPTKVSQLQNDAGYLTQHQDISGKLDAEKLPGAIDQALAEAKESGEFDGADGITPTIGANGNWYLGDTDTGKPSQGAAGEAPIDDTTESTEKVWSSSKTQSEISALQAQIDELKAQLGTTA